MPGTQKPKGHDAETVLFVRGMPREMLARLKAAAALQQQTLGDYLKGVFTTLLQDLERKGLLPKGSEAVKTIHGLKIPFAGQLLGVPTADRSEP